MLAKGRMACNIWIDLPRGSFTLAPRKIHQCTVQSGITITYARACGGQA